MFDFFKKGKDTVKGFAMKKMMQNQLKNLPKDQQESIMKAVETNPEFFEKIAKEIQVKMKGGKSQMAASMEVMRIHQDELRKIMQG